MDVLGLSLKIELPLTAVFILITLSECFSIHVTSDKLELFVVFGLIYADAVSSTIEQTIRLADNQERSGVLKRTNQQK